MHKAICYAYPTSTNAKRLGRARQGCYHIEVKAHYSEARCKRIEGPFDSLAQAEAAASQIAADWSPYSMREGARPAIIAEMMAR